MAYRDDFRDRMLRLPISMLRGNESEKERVETLAAVLEDEVAPAVRNVSLESADFLTAEEIAWFMQESGCSGIDALRQALNKFREEIRAARQMVAAADAMNYSSVGLPNRIRARVAHG